MKRIIVLIFTFLILSQCYSFAFGPPSYLPDGPHPRIWLDATRLAELDSYQESGDARWTAIESWCDLHLNDAGYDTGDVRWNGNNTYGSYRGFGYVKYLNTYALAYQLLKDDNPVKAATYATYAIQIMNGAVTGFSVGEEVNGLAMIRVSEVNDLTINASESTANGVQAAGYKLGYTARTFGEAFPIAYDWLYAELSAGEKTLFTSVMYRWVDWYRGARTTYNNGVLISGIRYHEDQEGDCTGINNCTSYSGIATVGEDGGETYEVGGNFSTSYIYMSGLIAAATYGDIPADDDTYYTHFRTTLWENLLKPQLESNLKYSGGGTVEGWNYGSSWQRVPQVLHAWNGATGEDMFTGFTWPLDFLKSYIHASHSDLTNMIIHGEWTGSYAGVLYASWLLSPTYIDRKYYPTENIPKVGQYFLDNATFQGSVEPYDEFLWYVPSATIALPSTEPLMYHETGVGRVTTRSSWTNAVDSVHVSVQLGGWKELSHSNYDEGNILITRGADRLLSHKNLQIYTEAQNSIRFAGQNHFTRNSEDLATQAIDRIEDTANYTYVRGDITHAWTRLYQTDRANLFYRSMLYLRPGFVVVSDITQSNPAVGNSKEWLTQYEASTIVSGNTIEAVNGASKIFTKTLYPTGGVYTETNPQTGFYRVSYAPSVVQEYDQFLHVIEATDSSQSNMTNNVQVVSTLGNMRGVYINDLEDHNKNWVVLFTSNQTGADVTGDVIFELGATSTVFPPKIIIADLPPNTDYTFTPPVNKNAIPQFFSFVRGVVTGKESQVHRSSTQGILYINPIEGTGGLR